MKKITLNPMRDDDPINIEGRHQLGDELRAIIKARRCYTCKIYHPVTDLLICKKCGKLMCPYSMKGSIGDDYYCPKCSKIWEGENL